MAASSCKRPAVNDDRLSTLPDCLLHTVMSFLPARQAVQTCVLSRRWEGLWCSMPCLDIDEREFCAWAIRSEQRQSFSSFEDFVNNLLMFHHGVPSLDRFRIDVDEAHESRFLDLWIRRGIKGCPRVVEIRLWNRCRNYWLPRFCSGSSRVKRLHLSGISLDDMFLQKLTSSFPVLKDLVLEHCYLLSEQITSCTMKNLTIEDCKFLYIPDALTITAPALAYLQLVVCDAGFDWTGVKVNTMSTHVKSTICIQSWDPTEVKIEKWSYDLLRSLINMRDLTLSGSKTLAVLHEGTLDNNFQVFHNLRTLIFDKCDLSESFEMLQYFLNNAPNLEKLTLQCCQLPADSSKRKTRDSRDTLTFKCPTLKLTEIKYKEEGDVQKLVDLLVGVWRILQKTTVVVNKAEETIPSPFCKASC